MRDSEQEQQGFETLNEWIGRSWGQCASFLAHRSLTSDQRAQTRDLMLLLRHTNEALLPLVNALPVATPIDTTKRPARTKGGFGPHRDPLSETLATIGGFIDNGLTYLGGYNRLNHEQRATVRAAIYAADDFVADVITMRDAKPGQVSPMVAPVEEVPNVPAARAGAAAAELLRRQV